MMSSAPGLQDRINEHYNKTMYSGMVDEYYDFSGYHNYGYWTPRTRTQREASENLVDVLVRLLPHHKGNILDVACGQGASSRRLLRHYAPACVTGINISEKQLATCRARAPGCRFINMDATRLRFASNSIDNILCVEAAFHFRSREKFLHEAWRVLRPGGGLALSDILVTPEAGERAVTKFIPAENLVSDVEDYRTMLTRAGFENIRLIEARAQTWEGFRDHSFEFMCDKVRSGQARMAQLISMRRMQNWRDWLCSNYLLVCAQKPGRGTVHR